LFYLCTSKSEATGYNRKELNGFKWFSPEELDEPRISESVRVTSLEALKLSEQY